MTVQGDGETGCGLFPFPRLRLLAPALLGEGIDKSRFAAVQYLARQFLARLLPFGVLRNQSFGRTDQAPKGISGGVKNMYAGRRVGHAVIAPVNHIIHAVLWTLRFSSCGRGVNYPSCCARSHLRCVRPAIEPASQVHDFSSASSEKCH
jgi:hypothetical protein